MEKRRFVGASLQEAVEAYYGKPAEQVNIDNDHSEFDWGEKVVRIWQDENDIAFETSSTIWVDTQYQIMVLAVDEWERGKDWKAIGRYCIEPENDPMAKITL